MSSASPGRRKLTIWLQSNGYHICAKAMASPIPQANHCGCLSWRMNTKGTSQIKYCPESTFDVQRRPSSTNKQPSIIPVARSAFAVR